MTAETGYSPFLGPKSKAIFYRKNKSESANCMIIRCGTKKDRTLLLGIFLISLGSVNIKFNNPVKFGRLNSEGANWKLHPFIHTSLLSKLPQNTVGVQAKAIRKSYPIDPMPMGAQKKDVEKGELPLSPYGFTTANPMPIKNRPSNSAGFFRNGWLST